MKRIITFILAISLGSSLLLSAQDKDKHNYDVGIGINAYGVLGVVGGPSRNISPGFLFEYRYDYTDRIDFGAQALFKHGKGHSAFTGGDYPTWGLTYNQIGLKAVADYNGRPGKQVRPYIGAELGGGALFTQRTNGTNDTDIFGTIGPRLGLQIWRFRVGLEIDFAFDGQYGFLSTETATALNLSFSF